MAPDRDLAMDFFRVTAIVLVVLGHWLLAAVTYTNGQFDVQHPLTALPWTQWVTWALQVVPVFFVVAGYASAGSWTRLQKAGATRADWVRHRVTRVAGPTAVYVFVVVTVVAVLKSVEVDGSALAFGGWAIGMQLWFLAVYLAVVALTPVLLAADRRWGLAVPIAMAFAVATIDVATLGFGVKYLGPANYLLCWGAMFQLGIDWHRGRLQGWRPRLLAVDSAAALAALVVWGPYPIAMIGIPGAAVQNTSPPTIALLAFGAVQAGLVLTVAPALNRRLTTSRWKGALAVANQNVMALYLWHMVPVVVVTLLGYPSGLLPQPPLGTPSWFLVRLEWLVLLSIATSTELLFLWWKRGLFVSPLPTIGIPLSDRWTGPVLPIGVAAIAIALSRLAAGGFAPDGRLPVSTLLLFAAGLALMALAPRVPRNEASP